MARLVVITGPAASGKTTFTHLLAVRMKAAALDYDTVGMPLLTAFAEQRGLPLADACREFRTVCHGTVLGIAAENLRLGQDVLLCAPFGREIETEGFFRDWKTAQDVSCEIIECRMQISAENLAKRVVGRGLARDAGKIGTPLAYARQAIERRHSWDPDRVFPIDANTELSGLETQARVVAADLSASTAQTA